MEESADNKPFHRQDKKDNYARSDRAPRVFKEKEYKGYYVDVTKSGGDAIRAFRKLKRMYKDTRFFEDMRDRQYYIKPTTKRRESEKKRRQVLRRLQRDRDISIGLKRPTKK
jgi:ribosomal protein S21